jgi:hypothetical protein
MRQSRLLAEQARNGQGRIAHFRRRAWTSRRILRAGAPEIAQVVAAPNPIPGEFWEAPRYPLLTKLRRGIGLTWDMMLILTLSPFFTVWFAYRGALRLKSFLDHK